MAESKVKQVKMEEIEKEKKDSEREKALADAFKTIEKAYGKPKDDDIYYSEVLKYYEYIYEIDETLLTLVIYEDRGLVEFEYKAY